MSDRERFEALVVPTALERKGDGYANPEVAWLWRRWNTVGTHYEGCWESGPRHYECALREIKRLHVRELLEVSGCPTMEGSTAG